jgi:hypothetical protein
MRTLTTLVATTLLAFLTSALSPAHAARGLVDQSFSPPAEDAAEATTSEEEVETEDAALAVPAEEPAEEPEQVEETVQDAPVVAPAPVAADVPGDTKGVDVAALLIVAAGGFAAGLLAGSMGCCLLFFAYYY